MVLNESSEADVGWQISIPSEDEKIDDDLDLDPGSPGSWGRKLSHGVDAHATSQVTLMDQWIVDRELCVCVFL